MSLCLLSSIVFSTFCYFPIDIHYTLTTTTTAAAAAVVVVILVFVVVVVIVNDVPVVRAYRERTEFNGL